MTRNPLQCPMCFGTFGGKNDIFCTANLNPMRMMLMLSYRKPGNKNFTRRKFSAHHVDLTAPTLWHMIVHFQGQWLDEVMAAEVKAHGSLQIAVYFMPHNFVLRSLHTYTTLPQNMFQPPQRSLVCYIGITALHYTGTKPLPTWIQM